MINLLFFMAQQPPPTPSGPRPLHYAGFTITLKTHHSRQDSSRRVINPSQRPLPDDTQHSQQTNFHAPSDGIRTHNSSRRAAVDRPAVSLLQVTANVRKSHRQSKRTLQFACEDRVLFDSVDSHVYLPRVHHSNASDHFVSCIHLNFVNFALRPPPIIKHLMELFLEIQTALFRQPFRIRHLFIRNFSHNNGQFNFPQY